MTPIESLIEEMKFRNNHDAVLRLQIMLVHEKYFMRKVAENAWDAAIVNLKECSKYESEISDLGCSKSIPTSPDKQTYLNQNHPL